MYTNKNKKKKVQNEKKNLEKKIYKKKLYITDKIKKIVFLIIVICTVEREKFHLVSTF